MRRCDVLVVGGGPGGSSCAWALRRSGLDVVLLDRAQFPRDKVCAGWITPAVVEALSIDLDEYGRQRTLQPITGFRTGVMGGPLVSTNYDSPQSYGIRRCEFDDFLLRRCGADLQLGTPVRVIERHNRRWRINGEFEAPVLIGAGGNFCPVARHLGAGDGRKVSLVRAQELEFAMDAGFARQCHVEPNVPELYFCDDLQGYGWCFRKQNVINIGLGRVDGEGLTSAVRAFVDFLRIRGRVEAPPPVRFHGHAYRLYERRLPRLVDEAVMLVGDAAGLAYPQSGEGIRPAVESGLLAAAVIRDGRGPLETVPVESYEAQVLARFGSPRRIVATDWLPAACLKPLARSLLSTHWFSRRVLLEKWFLHKHVPALANQGL